MAEQNVERRLAAVLAADVVGYSRMMAADEEGTLARLNSCRRELWEPTIAEHRGRVVKRTGDGMLVEFGSAVDAGITLEDVQGVLIAVAPIVGAPRIAEAAAHIATALGIAIELAEAELDAEAD